MGLDSIWHWLIVLVIVLVIFGTGKLKNIGSDIGGAVRNFKKAMNEDDEAAKTDKAATVEQLKADPPAAGDAKTESKASDHRA